jgi:hypothetical protein
VLFIKDYCPCSLTFHTSKLFYTSYFSRSCWNSTNNLYSEATDIGMSRLALSDADKQARDWFVKITESLGCTTTVDSMGNIFAVRPGSNEGLATFAGSHLDTQPSGQ